MADEIQNNDEKQHTDTLKKLSVLLKAVEDSIVSSKDPNAARERWLSSAVRDQSVLLPLVLANAGEILHRLLLSGLFNAGKMHQPIANNILTRLSKWLNSSLSLVRHDIEIQEDVHWIAVALPPASDLLEKIIAQTIVVHQAAPEPAPEESSSEEDSETDSDYTSDESSEESSSSEEAARPIPEIHIAVKPKTQRQRKAEIVLANRKEREQTVNQSVDWHDIKRAFDYARLETPRTVAEAHAVKRAVDARKRRILEMLLTDVCRKPEIGNHLISIYYGIPLPSVSCHPVVGAKDEQDAQDAPSVSVEAVESQADPYSFFPSIAPYKAAQLFLEEDKAKLGAWHIFVSGPANSDLRNLRDKKSLEVAIKKIVELSNGFFSDDNQKLITPAINCVPIYEAKALGDMRIVWSVDLREDVKADESSGSTHKTSTPIIKQVIKIWAVATHAGVESSNWAALAKQSKARSAEYRRKCNFRQEGGRRHGHKVKNVIPPAEWPRAKGEEDLLVQGAANSTDTPKLSDEDLLKLHQLLALSKFTPLSTHLIKLIMANDDETAQVFDVAQQEREIIDHDGSLFVIGRSGSGKTTCITFRLFGIQKAYEKLHPPSANALEKHAKIRQLFITQSPVLTARIREYYDKLEKAASVSNMAKSDLDKLVSDSQQNKQLYDRDDHDLEDAGLPESWSELEDSHFPLFLSFTQLARLLEADFGIRHGFQMNRAQRQAISRKPVRGYASTSVLHDTPSVAEETTISSGEWQHLVTYEVFLQEWSHFDARLTARLDPNLTWNEIIGVISGSEEAGHTDEGYLSREQYLNMSIRSHSLLANSRDKIYSIFLLYRKWKTARHDFDAADRTHTLLRHLKNRDTKLHGVDFLYVDEAQDHLLLDAALLRQICTNSRGYFFAGDTAQTISRGSSFRFEDLKACFYRLECAEPLVLAEARKPLHPAQYQLSINYRSHQAIVSLAASIVSTVLHFWPFAIDKLRTETGQTSGPIPIAFTGMSESEQFLEGFMLGHSEGGAVVEFGADSVILVRSDDSRDRLREVVGDAALILTIYESKGLKFENVLLYEYFDDGHASANDWRVLYNLIEDPALAATAPKFDETRHSVLCLELKQLYVAITRARKHLWIWDTSASAEPLQALWKSKGLIRVHVPGDPLPVLRASSTPDDWVNVGMRLFEHGTYAAAIVCFRRAGHEGYLKITLAYEQRRKARLLARKDVSQGRHAFLLAGDLFVDATDDTDQKQQAELWPVAAKCYDFSQHPLKAARAYEQSGNFELAAQRYSSVLDYDNAVRVVKQHKVHVQAETAESVLDRGSMLYASRQEWTKLLGIHGRVQAVVEWLQDYGYQSELVPVLEATGSWEEAAGYAEDRFEYERAARLYTKVDRESARELALACYVRAIWQSLSLATLDVLDNNSGNPSKTVLQTIEKAQALANTLQHPPSHLLIQLSLQTALLAKDTAAVRNIWSSKQDQTKLIQFHCLEKLTRHNVRMDSHADWSRDFLLYQAYLRLVKKVTEELRSDLPEGYMQAALGIYADPESGPDLCTILPTSPFHAFAAKESTSERVSLSWNQLKPEVISFWQKRLNPRISALYSSMRQSPQLRSPCPAYIKHGVCKQDQCSDEHLGTEYTQQAYNSRTEIVVNLFTLLRSAKLLLWDLRNDTLQRDNSYILISKLPSSWLIGQRTLLLPAAADLPSIRDLDPRYVSDWDQLTNGLQNFAMETLFSLQHNQPSAVAHFLYASLLSTELDPLLFLRHAYDLRITVTDPIYPALTRSTRDGRSARNVLQDYVSFFNSFHHGQVVMQEIYEGLEFTKFLCFQNRFSLDGVALCNFLEILTSVIVVGARSNLAAFQHLPGLGFNELTLPLPMLRTLALRYMLPIHATESLIRPLCHRIKDFAKALRDSRTQWTHSTLDQRNIFYRINLLLLLIGYNIPSLSIKSLVADLSRWTQIETPPSTNNYTTWVDLKVQLAEVARQVGGSVFELREVRIGDWSGEAAGMEAVKLAKVARIEHLAELLSPALTTQHMAARGQFHQSSVPEKASAKPQDDGTSSNPFAILQHGKDDENTFLQDMANVITTEMQNAVAVLVKHVRLHIKQKNGQKLDLHKLDNQLITKTHQRFVTEIGSVVPRLRLYLLGPVVHLHVAVRLLTDEIVRRKQATDVLQRVGRGSELDEMHIKIKQITANRKELKLLSDAFKHDDYTARFDLEEAKIHMQQAAAVFEKMDSQDTFAGPSTRADLLKHLQLAKRGLVEAAKPPKPKQSAKPLKPSLNINESLDDDVYDSDGYSDEEEL